MSRFQGARLVHLEHVEALLAHNARAVGHSLKMLITVLVLLSPRRIAGIYSTRRSMPPPSGEDTVSRASLIERAGQRHANLVLHAEQPVLQTFTSSSWRSCPAADFAEVAMSIKVVERNEGQR